MKNIAIVKCYQMRLVVSCSRCRTRSELDLNAHQAHNAVCGQCHAGMSVTLRAEPMHMASSILGYLDLDGCEVFDGLPASYTVSCFECTTETQFKNVPVGRVIQEKSCLQCHTKLSLAFERYAIHIKDRYYYKSGLCIESHGLTIFSQLSIHQDPCSPDSQIECASNCRA